MSGPATGRRKRAEFLRALSACLALIGLDHTAAAQTLTSDLMRPVPDGFVSPQDSPLRKINDPGVGDAPAGTTNPIAPSRIGKSPTYGVPAPNPAATLASASLKPSRTIP